MWDGVSGDSKSVKEQCIFSSESGLTAFKYRAFYECGGVDILSDGIYSGICRGFGSDKSSDVCSGVCGAAGTD